MQNNFHFSIHNIIISAIIFIAFYFAFALLPLNIKFRFEYTRNCLLLLLLTSLGCFRFYTNNVKNNEQFVGKFSSPQAYLISLKEPLTSKPKTWKSTAFIEKILDNGKWKTAKGKIFVYIYKDSLPPNLEAGSQLIFKKPLQEIRNAGNPGEFDYTAYCHQNGIYFQQFLNKEDFNVLPQKHISFLSKKLNDTRAWIIKKIDENISGNQERAVAKALLIGYRSDLDKDILQAFSNAGVIHIIAISGMHLALIAYIFIWLLSPLKRLKHGNIIHTILIIIILWIFTFVAGAVASITRAAIMFTIILLAKIFQRQSSIYNSLAFSAFLLLLINPYYLWDAGFILSYAAVLSISLFYKPISNLIKFDNKIIKFLWQTIALSLAAQILTLPFVLYYFHRFPVLFLLANIVAVPLSAIILYAEIIMFALSFFSPLSLFAGKIVEKLISFFDTTIQLVGNISFSVIEGIYINILQVVLLIIATFCIYFFIKIKNKIAITTTLVCAFCFFTINIVRHIHVSHQQKTIVYNISKHTVIDFVKGSSYVNFSDTTFTKFSEEYQYILKPARNFLHVKTKNNFPELRTIYPEFQFKNKSIFILNNSSANQLDTNKKTDVFILSNNVDIDFRQMKNHFPKTIFVFDNTNKLWKINQWKKACDSVHLHFHSIPAQGAFVMNL
ncbi:hypothetical protein A9P82_06835 [Arachidicoccus ginsenosidimutans]|nr:hypothetical protein A9P82_06835 [Arachidicoccus sp. BS20]